MLVFIQFKFSFKFKPGHCRTMDLVYYTKIKLKQIHISVMAATASLPTSSLSPTSTTFSLSSTQPSISSFTVGLAEDLGWN